MFDVKKAQAEAEKEIAEDQAKIAKGKIKDHLKRISTAKAVVANLEREYEVMLREIGAE